MKEISLSKKTIEKEMTDFISLNIQQEHFMNVRMLRSTEKILCINTNYWKTIKMLRIFNMKAFSLNSSNFRMF